MLSNQRFARTLAIAAAAALLPVGVHATQEDVEVPNLAPSASYSAVEFPEVPSTPVQVHEGPAVGTSGAIAPAAQQPSGVLSGRIVFMSAGHGWTFDIDWSPSEDEYPDNLAWYTQRGDYNEIVEDLQNQDQMSMFAYYCFNAGATVVAMRPIGNQSNEVVLDNDDAGVTFTGAWVDSGASIFYGDSGDTPYRYASTSATQTATARYTPTIPEAGFYPIYCWTRAEVDRVDDQLYRIVHTGGTTEVRIDHRMVGNGWIYLGTYYLDAGTGAYVEISNQSSDTVPASPIVVADAIRFGNGMGDIDRGGGVSGYAREDECSRYWVQAMLGQGAGSSPHNSSTSDANDNVSAPSRMAALMNRETEGVMTDRVYLGFHSNASWGSLGLYNGNNVAASKTPNQLRWAELVGRECNDDLVAIGSPPLEYPWTEQGPDTSDVTLDRTDIEFGEIRGDNTGYEFDATIIEVAGHNPAGNDPRNLRNPNCRNWLARASLQATIRYFNEFGGGALVFPPEPPTEVSAISDGSGNVTVTWDVPVVDGIGGQAATGYVVYRSANGYGFGNPVVVAGGGATSTLISGLTPDQVVYFRVAATNAGGESLPSETVGCRPLPSGDSTILVVNGFDRFDYWINPRETAASGMGGPLGGGATYDRIKPRLSNSFDYVVQIGDSLDILGYPFDSCQNEDVIAGDVVLGDYDTVLWILGEEGTADESFNSTEQSLVTAYLNGGGNLFLSGAEIAYDLDRTSGPSAADRTFFNSVLHADYVGDDSATYSVANSGGGIFAGNALFAFDDGTSGQYDSEYPDQLGIPAAPNNTGVVVAMTYSGGSGGNAALTYDGSGTTPGKVVILGFPFETITSSSARVDLMDDVLSFFVTPVPVELSGFTTR